MNAPTPTPTAQAAVYQASVTTAYEHHGYRLGALTRTEQGLLASAWIKGTHPGDVANSLLVLRFGSMRERAA